MLDSEHRRADVEAGLRAPREDLRRRLRSASTAYLDGAVENPAFGPDELVLALRNRAARAEWLRRIGTDRALTARAAIRKLLVLHPNAPLAVSQNLLPYLNWSDMAEVSQAPGANPVLRRQAERLVRGRLAEMSAGEKVALARRATRGVIPDLILSDEERVLRSLLHNPRLVERDAVRIVERPAAGAGLLDHLVTASPWANRRTVRLAVLENPRTPVAVGLRLLRSLDPRDLRDVARRPRVPRVIRVGAERRLAAAGGGSRSRSAP